MSAAHAAGVGLTEGACRREAVLRCVALSAALAAASAARAALNGTTTETAFVAGALFGAALLLVAAVGWPRGRVLHLPASHAVAIGLLGGAGLIVVPLLVGAARSGAFRPEPFVLWAAITCLVALGEETLLRGALFDTATEAFGTPAAVLLTSSAFALMHVPLYGSSIVPVDFAAGLALAGLRLLSGGVAAPAIAHALADLATWWL